MRRLPLLLALLGAVPIASAIDGRIRRDVDTNTNPFYVPYEDGVSAGPDGPWHVLGIHVDFPEQVIYLYPGGTNATLWINSDACDSPTATCPLPADGLWTPSGATIGSFYDLNSGLIDPSEWDPMVSYPLNLTGRGNFIKSRTVLHASDSLNDGLCEAAGSGLCYLDYASEFVSESLAVNYPGGSQYSYTMDVGLFSLAATAPNQTISWYAKNGTVITYNQTLMNGYQQGYYPSLSYGLHIGSVRHRIPGSLWLGGFDQNRLIDRPVVSTSQWVELIDIGLGVEEGANVFYSTPPHKTEIKGLLRGGIMSGGSMNALPNPAVPYMYLPGDTCDAIAAHLPVTYNPDLNLYLWDDGQDEKFTASPAFLSFEFNSGVSTRSTTIYIPFALLVMTLTPPLADTPTPYFPCSPFNPNPADSNNVYHLGRAFLQAAFLSQNWGNGTSYTFLGQAPGPQIPKGKHIATILGGDSSLKTLSNAPSWYATWGNDLTPVPASQAVHGEKPASGSGNGDSLSTGAQAGIGVAVALGVILIVGLIGFLYVRRRRAKAKAQAGENSGVIEKAELETPPRDQWTDEKKAGAAELKGESIGTEHRHEMDANQVPQELPAPVPTAELTGESKPSSETTLT